jgi:hypothetical protein
MLLFLPIRLPFEILADAEQKIAKQGQFLSVKPSKDLAIKTTPPIVHRRPDVLPCVGQIDAGDALVTIVGTAYHETGLLDDGK